MTSEHLLQGCIDKPAETKHLTFRQISQQSRTRLKKAVRARDRDALEDIILDMEHYLQVAAGSLVDVLTGTISASRSFGKYYAMAMETLSRAEAEYQKLVNAVTGMHVSESLIIKMKRRA